FVKKIPHLKSANNIHNTSWVLTFDTEKDMRPIVFDFAQENGLKILNLTTQNKNLESLFREFTS
ncbi:MAG: gliding motility-associated ABC transporter ATP-binding subunit GldA, partial [Proteobacteria bacterium]|nr:gliding motility-associated ABC transporter ATP-binding subunit GldA [Pseudomonadota bacterium]